jgi:hypothetical protein
MWIAEFGMRNEKPEDIHNGPLFLLLKLQQLENPRLLSD